MQIKYYYILLIVMFIHLGCSKDDDDDLKITIESFDATEIEFVYSDGSSISANECIIPNEPYAIQIKTTKNSSGNTNVSKIGYTINGALYSMSFSEAGTKRNPINLVDGRNIAELSATATTDEISYYSQDDFELVN